MRGALPVSDRRKARALTPRLIDWFHQVARDLPWRRTRDPYAIWVSEIMLQQTQVRTVLPYYERWMQALPTIESLARASAPRLHKLWEGLGYYRRVRHLQRAARTICQDYHGRFPDRFEDVLSLPGIGRYTAGAICSIAFNQPTPILDGNVIRVLCRLFGITSNPREAPTNARLWSLADALVQAAAHYRTGTPPRPLPPAHRPAPHAPYELLPQIHRRSIPPCSALNQSLMELGATVCTPTHPLCPTCPVRSACTARRFDRIDRIPPPKARPQIIKVRCTVLVAERDGRVWAVQRPAGRHNSGLWEFPQVEEITRHDTRQPVNQDRRDLMLALAEPLGTYQHAITRHRITAYAYLRRNLPAALPLTGPGRWLTPTAVRRAPFSALHRRIANAALDRLHTG